MSAFLIPVFLGSFCEKHFGEAFLRRFSGKPRGTLRQLLRGTEREFETSDAKTFFEEFERHLKTSDAHCFEGFGKGTWGNILGSFSRTDFAFASVKMKRATLGTFLRDFQRESGGTIFWGISMGERSSRVLGERGGARTRACPLPIE